MSENGRNDLSPNDAPQEQRWRKIAYVAALLFCLLFAAFLVMWWNAPPDPIYKGRRLSTLLYSAHAPFFTTPGRRVIQFATIQNSHASARAALRELGPEAVPLLVVTLRSSPLPSCANPISHLHPFHHI